VAQQQTPVRLNAEQQKLFDEPQHQRRVAVVFSIYRRFIPDARQDDLRQCLLIALAQCFHSYNGRVDFGRYVFKRLESRARAFVWGPNRLRSASLLNAQSLDDGAAVSDDGESFTLGNQLEALRGKRQNSTALSADHHAAMLFDVIRDLKILAPFERKVFRLRFIKDLELKAIGQRLGCSGVTVKRTIRSGVAKLRDHFRRQGFRALPTNAPMPQDGNRKGCNWAVRRKRLRNRRKAAV